MKTTAVLTVALLIAIPAITFAQQTVIFTEDFNDGLAANRWSDLVVTQENTGIAADSTVDYAFDYSTIQNPFDGGNPIPSAPNTTDGSTLGIYITSNNTNQCPDAANPGCAAGGGIDDEGEGAGVFHETFDLPASGNYVVQFDVFNYWNGGGGSTEYNTVGIFHQRTDEAPLRFGLGDGSGLAYQADTDGDTSTDLIRFEGPGGQTGLGGWEDIPAGTIPNVPTGGGLPNGIFSQWVTMELEVSDTHDNVAWKINGALINLFDNSTAGFNAGTIFLGHSDPFNSVNAAIAGFTNGSIIDNVIVTTIPEPSAVVLALLAALGCLGCTRRTS